MSKPKTPNRVASSAGLDDIVLVFDTKLKRPACVLLQAVYGCGHNNGFLQMTFDSRTWLVAPTPDMVRIRGTREQWKRSAAMSANAPLQASGTEDDRLKQKRNPALPASGG